MSLKYKNYGKNILFVSLIKRMDQLFSKDQYVIMLKIF